MGRGLALCAVVAGVLVVALAAASGPSPAIRAVVVAGHSVPGGGRFASFTVESLPVLAPVNDEDQVTFFDTLRRAPGGEGLFLRSRDRVTKVARPAFQGGARR